MYEIIVAVCKNNGIGRNDIIPWHIPEDLLYFQKKTRGHTVVMGRKTFFSIPEKHRPLRDRINIVLTNTPEAYAPASNLFFTRLGDLDHYLPQDGKIFIIGGEAIYRLFYPCVDTIHMTIINKYFECDAVFPHYYDFYVQDYSQHQYSDDEKCTFHHITLARSKNKEYATFMATSQNLEEMQYLQFLRNILSNGHRRNTRNGPVLSLFGGQLSYDLQNGFPLLTTKKMFLRGIFEELRFFLMGKTDTTMLEEKKVFIWRSNTDRSFLDQNHLPYKEGDMGPMYGFQLLHFNAPYEGCNADYANQGLNQLHNIVDMLINDRFSRRMVMTTFNPLQADQGVLYPCHGLTIQFGIQGENELCCHMYQRSCDFFLGIPFNIASYALLTHILCNIVNENVRDNKDRLKVGRLTISLGDCHIYISHLDAVRQQLEREPHAFPQLAIQKSISSVEDISALSFNDLSLSDYECYPPLRAKMIA